MAIINPKTLLMQAAQDFLKPKAFGDGSMDAYKKREGIIEAEGQYKKRSRMAGDSLAQLTGPMVERAVDQYTQDPDDALLDDIGPTIRIRPPGFDMDMIKKQLVPYFRMKVF